MEHSVILNGSKVRRSKLHVATGGGGGGALLLTNFTLDSDLTSSLRKVRIMTS